MKYAKKYWWVLIALLLLPKIIDLLFCIHLSPITALYHIEANDILNYISAIFGGVCALIAIIIAIRQFVITHAPLIVPISKDLYYFDYGDKQEEFLSEQAENPQKMSILTPLIVLENVSDITADYFHIEINYENVSKLLDKINLNISDNDIPKYKNESVEYHEIFSGKSKKELFVGRDLFFLIRTICSYMRKSKDIETYSIRYANFTEKPHKIASLTVITNSITDATRKDIIQKYDVKLRLFKEASRPQDTRYFIELFYEVTP